MHPIFHEELNRARIAERHRRAERDRLARASAQARRARRQDGKAPPTGAAWVVARRLLIILSARGA
jgi:hypothetical protein